MNDMDMVRQLGEDLFASETEPPAALRQRVVGGGTPAAVRPWRTCRLGLVGAATVSLVAATAVAVAVYNGPATDAPTRQEAGQQRVEPAADVLRHAALLAHQSRSRIAAPRSDQYVFTEVLSVTAFQTVRADGTVETLRRGPLIGQTWLSVDGVHAGMVRTRPPDQSGPWQSEALPGCPSVGRTPDPGTSPSGRPGRGDGCRGAPRGVDPTVPNQPQQMLAWLYDTVRWQQDDQQDDQQVPRRSGNDQQVPRRSGGELAEPGRSPGGQTAYTDQLAFQIAGELLGGPRYLTPQQQAALFEALALIPGVTTASGARDAAGRSGLGIGMPENTNLIFDPGSYAFLGTARTSVLRQEIVDHRGQLPA